VPPTPEEAHALWSSFNNDGIVTLAEVEPAVEGFVDCLQEQGIEVSNLEIDETIGAWTVSLHRTKSSADIKIEQTQTIGAWTVSLHRTKSSADIKIEQTQWELCQARHLGTTELTEPGRGGGQLDEAGKECLYRIGVEVAAPKDRLWDTCQLVANRSCRGLTEISRPVCSYYGDRTPIVVMG